MTCQNCNDYYCMDCVLRIHHEDCKKDCPVCCTHSLIVGIGEVWCVCGINLLERDCPELNARWTNEARDE